jgi:hypothetical protein
MTCKAPQPHPVGAGPSRARRGAPRERPPGRARREERAAPAEAPGACAPPPRLGRPPALLRSSSDGAGVRFPRCHAPPLGSVCRSPPRGPRPLPPHTRGAWSGAGVFGDPLRCVAPRKAAGGGARRAVGTSPKLPRDRGLPGDSPAQLQSAGAAIPYIAVSPGPAVAPRDPHALHLSRARCRAPRSRPPSDCGTPERSRCGSRIGRPHIGARGGAGRAAVAVETVGARRGNRRRGCPRGVYGILPPERAVAGAPAGPGGPGGGCARAQPRSGRAPGARPALIGALWRWIAPVPASGRARAGPGPGARVAAPSPGQPLECAPGRARARAPGAPLSRAAAGAVGAGAPRRAPSRPPSDPRDPPAAPVPPARRRRRAAWRWPRAGPAARTTRPP